jgi:hypothetical protein
VRAVLNLKGSVAHHANFGQHQTRRRWDILLLSPSWRQPVQRLQDGNSRRATVTTTWLKSHDMAQWRSPAYHDNTGCSATSHDHQVQSISFYSRPNPPPLRDLLLPHRYPQRGKHESPRRTQILARAHQRWCTEPSVLIQATIAWPSSFMVLTEQIEALYSSIFV